MADVSTQEIEQLVSKIENVSGSLRGVGELVAKSRAEARLERDLAGKEINEFGERLITAGEAVTEATTSFNTAMRYFGQAFLGGGVIALAVTGLGRIVGNVTNTYRDLAKHGQLFNGSILEMQRQAGAAALPLEDFADLTIKNSLVIAQMGKRDWPRFQRQLRETMIQHGNFAMSMEMLAEYQTTLLETQRRAGAVEHGNNARRVNDMVELAAFTQELASATGMATKEITQLANSALQGSMALARVRSLPEGVRGQVTQQLQSVMAVMASQAGSAGEFMSKLLANTYGSEGLGQFTDEGQTLIKAGLGSLVGRMNEVARSLDPEDAVDAVNSFIDGIGRNSKQLRLLAMGGNQQARQMLEIHQEMSRLSKAELRRRTIEQGNVNKFLLTIESVWNSIVGGFKEGFLAGFEPFFKSIGDINNSQAMKRFGELFKDFGTKLGSFVGEILSEENLKSVGQGLKSFVEAIAIVPWMDVFSGIGSAVSGLAWVIGKIVWLSGQIMEIFTSWPKLLTAVGAALGGLLIFKGLRGIWRMFAGTDMMINARNVIVNGMGLGGGLGGDGGFGGGSGGGRSRAPRGGTKHGMTRAERISSINARRAAAGKGALGLAKAGKFASFGKAAFHSGIKKVPIIGALAGIGFGLMRARSGDWVGAAMEVGSGVAGSFPGLGTAASLGLDMALGARDMGVMPTMGGAASAVDPSSSTARPSRAGRFGKTALSLAAPVAAGAGAAYALGLIGSDEADAAEPEEPKKKKKTPEPDPQLSDILSAIRQLIEVEHESQDLMMNIARSQTSIGNDNLKLLDKLTRRS